MENDTYQEQTSGKGTYTKQIKKTKTSKLTDKNTNIYALGNNYTII